MLKTSIIRRARPSPVSNLLKLPLEIRLHIYGLMIELPRSDHLHLLCICKQVYSEAKESLFRRPVSCSSQKNLKAFTDYYSKTQLSNVVSLKVELQQLESDDVASYIHKVAVGQPVTHEENPYYIEVQRTIGALKKLPSIKHLTILRPTQSQTTTLPRHSIQEIIDWARRHYRRLDSLTFGFEDLGLEFLSSFSSLRSFQFSGFSQSSPDETAQILKRLIHLAELRVIGPSPHLSRYILLDDEFVPSMTPEVMASICPLKSIVFSEIQDLDRQKRPVFLTANMVKSMFETHQEKLEELQISCLATPDKIFVAYLSAFIMNSNIKTLCLGWPEIGTEVLDCLPHTIHCLEVAVESQAHARAILQRLKAIHYRLRDLRYIKFSVINTPTAVQVLKQKETTMYVALPMQQLAILFESPWSLKWGIWQPVLQYL